jgi:hypothetical protein
MQKLYKQVGTSFLTGQAFALASALYHSSYRAPMGMKLMDFMLSLHRSSFANGIQFATWSCIGALIDPVFSRVTSSEAAAMVLGGAATSAILDWRNGNAHMVKSAVFGAAQSLMLNGFGNAAEVILKPLDSIQARNYREQFFKERNEASFVSPLSAIESVFMNKQ